MEKIGSTEKTIATLGDGRWPNSAKQEGDTTSNKFLRNMWKNILSAQMLEVSIRSSNGAPSQKGCVVNGQSTKAINT